MYEPRTLRNLTAQRPKRIASRYSLQMIFRKIPKVSLQSDSQKIYSGTQELLDGEEGLAGYNLDVVRKLATGLGMGANHIGGVLALLSLELGRAL